MLLTLERLQCKQRTQFFIDHEMAILLPDNWLSCVRMSDYVSDCSRCLLTLPKRFGDDDTNTYTLQWIQLYWSFYFVVCVSSTAGVPMDSVTSIFISFYSVLYLERSKWVAEYRISHRTQKLFIRPHPTHRSWAIEERYQFKDNINSQYAI